LPAIAPFAEIIFATAGQHSPATYALSISPSVASESLALSGKMAAFGTRFDALSEEEEIDFEDKSMDDSSAGSSTGHPVKGAVQGAYKKK
jgi:hypothetical protein